MDDIQKYCIDRDRTLREAMKQLDVTSKKILFVVNERRLVASLTDGDLRRFLLSGGTLDDTVYAASFKTPRSETSREDAILSLDGLQYVAMPVVTTDQTIVDIVFADEKEAPAYPQLNLPVVIMAGGKGTRLEPYTKILPKPLIPVGDLPIIEHIMKQFIKYGCNDFHIVVNHKKQLIKAFFAENEYQYQVHWYDELVPLGTGGGLSMLKGKVSKTFILTNCDTLLLCDYGDILDFHRKHKNAVTMICAYKNLTLPYGVIETGSDGEIVAMKEKPQMSFETNTGLYIVEPEVLDDIEPQTSIGFPDIVAKQQEKGRRVAAYPISENDWLDMGQLEELERMRVRLYGE